VLRLADHTGSVAIFDRELAGRLARAHLDLPRELQVPGSEFPVFCEELLHVHAVLLDGALDGEGAVLTLRSLHEIRRRSGRQLLRFVGPDERAVCAAHPAMLFTTLVRLPNLDAREVANTMRAALVDPFMQQLVAAGSPDVLLLHGFGREIVRFAAMLEAADAAATQSKPAAGK
jgi:hypothetical protein